MTHIIENVRLINGERCTIIIKDGKISEMITGEHHSEGEVISLPENSYVSSGWIDLHTHAFPKYQPYCAKPDEIGYLTGVTTVVDAGSSGADDFDEFHEISKQSVTNVWSFLNVSRIGLKVTSELADLANLSADAIEATLQKYPDQIVGLKARMSQSVIGNHGIKPLKMAKEIARKVDLPLMVHIGSAPPKLADILACLDEGDIVTHCFHEKTNNHIYYQENLTALKDAVARGVYLDIGHGTSSFSFDIARRAKNDDIPFHTISTDIYHVNRVNGPVHNMATTLTKFLALGYSLKDVIRSVTENPAKIIHQPDQGKIKIGTDANLTFFSVQQKEALLKDSFGNELIHPDRIVPIGVFTGGNYYDCQ